MVESQHELSFLEKLFLLCGCCIDTHKLYCNAIGRLEILSVVGEIYFSKLNYELTLNK